MITRGLGTYDGFIPTRGYGTKNPLLQTLTYLKITGKNEEIYKIRNVGVC